MPMWVISSNRMDLLWRIFIAMKHAQGRPYDILITQPQVLLSMHKVFLARSSSKKNKVYDLSRHVTPQPIVQSDIFISIFQDCNTPPKRLLYLPKLVCQHLIYFFPTSTQITLGGGQIFPHHTMSSFNSVRGPAPKM